ncbi:MAG: hypothetical protein R3240_00390 [Gammaproteobacteria bacterium]|nr:hypothetical protein [Gammaproteobacteria bacterium]
MIGKKNVVFGFLLLVCTASLGPYMVFMYESQDAGSFVDSTAKKQQTVGRLQSLKTNGYEEDLESLPAEDIAKANTDGILAINQLNNAEFAIDYIKGGPHAHGNLEALLNIVVGVLLGFIAVAPILKNIVSWMFIIGASMHGGMLMLERAFGFEWATTLLHTGIGPVLILAGLLSMGILAWMGFENRFSDDY